LIAPAALTRGKILRLPLGIKLNESQRRSARHFVPGGFKYGVMAFQVGGWTQGYDVTRYKIVVEKSRRGKNWIVCRKPVFC
jgi:hypothetical protein